MQSEGDHVTGVGVLWPMMRPGAMSDATRALRSLWHEIRVGPATRPKATSEKPTATGYVASVE
eukprot:4488910-Prymnesium_polylepis.1